MTEVGTHNTGMVRTTSASFRLRGDRRTKNTYAQGKFCPCTRRNRCRVRWRIAHRSVAGHRRSDAKLKRIWLVWEWQRASAAWATLASSKGEAFLRGLGLLGSRGEHVRLATRRRMFRDVVTSLAVCGRKVDASWSEGLGTSSGAASRQHIAVQEARGSFFN